jgi:hypothetical protein
MKISIIAAAVAASALASAASAQVTTVDPNAPPPASEVPVAAPAPADEPAPPAAPQSGWQTDTQVPPGAPPRSASDRAGAALSGRTVPRKDVFTAAEGVFGKGAKGLGDMIERLLKDQGEPNAYITGREAGGAIVVGLRYGSGTLHHQIEGDRPIYWTGPSLGFDFGADASKVFVLVYNLNDGQDIFHRYPAAEGNAYVVGGFTASYLRRGNIVLIPVRLGVGARLGINAGYMRFSTKNRWLPF